MTYLEAINDVLVRLRETQVSVIGENEYSSLIEKFINDAKKSVENAWDWTALRSQIQVTTASGTQQYTLTNAGERFRVINVIDDTNDTPLRKAPSQTWMDRRADIGDSQQAQPLYYNFKGVDSNSDPYVDLWPIPNGTYTLNFELVVPQVELSATTDVITVPWYPVVLGAYAKAISERGEDGGQSYNEADQAYRDALSDAVGMDSARVQDELIWNY